MNVLILLYVVINNIFFFCLTEFTKFYEALT